MVTGGARSECDAMSAPPFVGFGFGAIQAGLFLAEAQASGAFDRLVVAEVNEERIRAIRENGGAFCVHIATSEGRQVRIVRGVEILNPTVPQEAARLVEALAEAREIATALPSVAFYRRGTPSVADLLREAALRKIADSSLPDAVVYTAENDNQAAERLRDALCEDCDPDTLAAIQQRVQALNTVIGKMSSVVADPERIRALHLEPFAPGAREAFLVESFNRILISPVRIPGFRRCLVQFEEKPDLLPFEEAKLYGHNAIHALLGFLANERGLRSMSELSGEPDLLRIGRAAFIEECGVALVRKYAGVDPLFTPAGFTLYADDLLQRMCNPHLADPVERILRDPLRKLAWNDRLIGALRLCLAQSAPTFHLGLGITAAIRSLPDPKPWGVVEALWLEQGARASDILSVRMRLDESRSSGGESPPSPARS
jgi:mannitol-1-phosphate 5-dehydrogenase